MREIYREVIDHAFDAGISDAWLFWDMTAAEIRGRLRAHKAAHKIATEEITMRDDKLAWLIGIYVARGVNNPKKYPKKPDLIAVSRDETPDSEETPMDEDTMQTILTAYAEVHNAIEGAKE